MVISLLIAGGFGVAGMWLYTKHKENTANAEILKKALEINESIAKEAMGSMANVVAPMRTYAASLGSETTLSVAGSPPVLATEVKNILRQTTKKLPTFNVAADGDYMLLGIELKKDPPMMLIQQSGTDKTISASLLRMPPQMQQGLVKKVEQGLTERTLPLSIDLQLDVYFTEKMLKYASIVGVGAPRTGIIHYKLAEIPSNVAFTDAKAEGEPLVPE